jgi:hypothetical protein
LPTFVIASSCVLPTDRRVHDLRPGQTPEGKLDEGKGNEGGQRFGKVLEILDETPISSEPALARCSRRKIGFPGENGCTPNQGVTGLRSNFDAR